MSNEGNGMVGNKSYTAALLLTDFTQVISV